MIELSPGTIAVLAGVPSTAFGLWQAVQWLLKRHDERDAREDETDDKRDAARSERMRHERDELAALNASLLKELRSDVERYRLQVEEKSQDRARAWDLVYAWRERAWEMRHQALHARQISESAARVAGHPPPVWSGSLDLPPLNDENRKP